MRPVQGRGKKRRETIPRYIEIRGRHRQEEISYNHWIFIRSSMNTMSVLQLDLLSYIMNTPLHNVSEFGMLIL